MAAGPDGRITKGTLLPGAESPSPRIGTPRKPSAPRKACSDREPAAAKRVSDRSRRYDNNHNSPASAVELLRATHLELERLRQLAAQLDTDNAEKKQTEDAKDRPASLVHHPSGTMPTTPQSSLCSIASSVFSHESSSRFPSRDGSVFSVTSSVQASLSDQIPLVSIGFE